jgi:hypothetical protein
MITPFGIDLMQQMEPAMENAAAYTKTGTQTVGPDHDGDED